MINELQDEVTIDDNKNKIIKSNTTVTDENIKDYYQRYSRPGLSRLLKTLGMKNIYTRAVGNYLYYEKQGTETAVLDALGGFGACIFGHNHPPLVSQLQNMLTQQVPFLAQASTRKYTALMGYKLNSMFEERFGKSFVSITLNTGADAVEAALKHSELKRKKRLNEKVDTFIDSLRLLRHAQRNENIRLDDVFLEQASLYLGVNVNDQNFSLIQLESSARNLLLIRPTCLSVKRGYHGKTTGALQLTHGESYRTPFSSLGPISQFVCPDNLHSLESIIFDSMIELPCITRCGDKFEFKTERFSNISSLFVEPLQGEGGIHPLSKGFLQRCREMANQYDFSLIFDEIQSGMGRTGTFLFCEQIGVVPDVILLSKSLGGGLSKISVAAFEQSIYDKDFDEVHSSTFAEDDLSAGIALAALNIISQPEYLSKAKNIGEYLKSKLKNVVLEYSDVVECVRGEGLFLGFVFKSQVESDSFVIRFLSDTGMLGYTLSGHLLHEYDIRIGTTLSDALVLRIEPSLFITEQECDRLVQGLARAAECVQKANAYELTKYMVDVMTQGSSDIKDFRGINCGRLPKFEPGLPTVTFVATPASAIHVMDSDVSLKLYRPRQVVDLLGKIVEVLGPVETETRTIESITGEKINFRMLILMYDPIFISKRLSSGYLADILENIKNVKKDSEELNHRVLGLGSYTSIVSHNGLDLISDDISLTTGNALTVGMGARAILKSADEHQLDLSACSMAVLGAGGNIGSVYSEVLADHVPRLILIGRENRLARLYQTVITIYRQAHDVIEHNKVKESCVAYALSKTQSYREWKMLNNDTDASYERLIELLQQELGDEVPVLVTSENKWLKRANLILTCSNAPIPIVFPSMLGKQKTIICDVSVPQDVDDSVANECDNVELIRGGLVKLPRNPDIEWLGNQCIGKGVSYACMAETMLLGLEGIKEHGSYGKINKQEVIKILDIADMHGFELAKIKVEKIF
jgi:acetylornithine/succinyldiaminopimelate/putrescine aminotransferase/predicted amino acid dehydrogenase